MYFLRRAARIIQKEFENYACKLQDFLGDEARMTKFLSILPAEYKWHFLNLNFIKNNLIHLKWIIWTCLRRDEFGEKMRRGNNSSERWTLFLTHLKQFSVALIFSIILFDTIKVYFILFLFLFLF